MFSKFIKKTILPAAVAGIIIFSGNNLHALGSVELSKGMKDDNIQVLQEELKNIGLFNIEETTNYYGYYTELAVKQLQKTKGLEETGNYNKDTHEALKEIKDEILQEKIEKGEILGYERTLLKDFKGEDVTRVQKKLKELGYLDIEEFTDTYGPKTIAAVKRLQKTYGIPEDGATNEKVVNLINGLLDGSIEEKEPYVEEVEVVENTFSDDILSIANSKKGIRYSYGATGPNAYDCSGFTQAVFREAGKSIPRTTGGQAGHGTRVSRGNLQAGDLVLFAGTTRRGGISHVGIYVGDNKFIHASTSRGVVVDSLNSNYYRGKFSHGQRVR